jgi:hypothetical protein
MKKNTSLTQRYFQVLLTGTCFFLCYLLWQEIQATDISTTAENITNEMIEEETVLSFPGIENTLPEIDEFDEMINRPLFFENRQPFVFEEIADEKPEPKNTNTRKPREEYSLNAVIITPNKKIAIIESSKAKELQRIALGENIDDWTLESVEPREIKLINGKETKTLVLEIKNSAPNKKQPKSNTDKSLGSEIEKRKISTISPDTNKRKADTAEESTENSPAKPDIEDKISKNLVENQESKKEN